MVNIGVLLLRVAGSTVAAPGAQRLCRWCGEPPLAGRGSRLQRLSPRLGEARETIGGLHMTRRQHRRGDRPCDVAGDRRAGLRDWRGPPGPRAFRPVVWS